MNIRTAGHFHRRAPRPHHRRAGLARRRYDHAWAGGAGAERAAGVGTPVTALGDIGGVAPGGTGHEEDVRGGGDAGRPCGRDVDAFHPFDRCDGGGADGGFAAAGTLPVRVKHAGGDEGDKDKDTDHDPGDGTAGKAGFGLGEDVADGEELSADDAGRKGGRWIARRRGL